MAALAGDQAGLAAGMAYPEIPLRDRCEDHTDAPWWVIDQADPDTYLPVVRHYLDVVQCDWWPVWWRAPRDERAHRHYGRDGDGDYVVDTRTGERTPIYRPGQEPSGRARPSSAGPTPTDEQCLDRARVVPAQEQIETGLWDCARAVVQDLGERHFVYSYTNTPFVLSFGKGFEQTMVDVATHPAFLHRLADRMVEQQRENFRAMARLGIPGVWMQDFSAGAELIGREHYRELVLPHGRDLVAAAHEQGLVVIHHYMGDPSDRVDLVAAMGADVLLFEEARKGYAVDLARLTDDLPRDRPVLMGNLAAEGALAGDSSYELAEAVRRLVQFGRRRGRFVFGTGAPPTPATPLRRIASALAIARRLWDLQVPVPATQDREDNEMRHVCCVAVCVWVVCVLGCGGAADKPGDRKAGTKATPPAEAPATPSPAVADKPKAHPEAEKAAVAAAQAWLKLVDDGKYAASWDETAEYFRNAVPKDKWQQQIQSVRKPLGKVVSRKLKSTRYLTALPGAPDGQYVVVQFDASFEKKKVAVETVTPMLDADATWRVSGYYIR